MSDDIFILYNEVRRTGYPAINMKYSMLATHLITLDITSDRAIIFATMHLFYEFHPLSGLCFITQNYGNTAHGGNAKVLESLRKCKVQHEKE